MIRRFKRMGMTMTVAGMIMLTGTGCSPTGGIFDPISMILAALLEDLCRCTPPPM